MSIGKSSISRAEKAATSKNSAKNAALFSVGAPEEAPKTDLEVASTAAPVPKDAPKTASKKSNASVSKGVSTVPVSKITSSYSESSIACSVLWNELVESVKKHGIIEPLVVRKTGDTYRVISGHKRLFAAKKLEITSVEAKIIEVDDEKAAVIASELNKFSQDPITYGKEKAIAEVSQKKLPDYLL